MSEDTVSVIDQSFDQSTPEEVDLNEVFFNDLRLTSSLLAEYSEKLEIIIKTVTSQRKQQRLIQWCLPGMVVVGFLLMLLGIFQTLKLGISISAALFIVFLGGVIFFVNVLRELRRSAYSSHKQGQRLAHRLERLIRFGSELSQLKKAAPGETESTSNFAQIELDFRLVDAGETLERFNNLEKRHR